MNFTCSRCQKEFPAIDPKPQAWTPDQLHTKKFKWLWATEKDLNKLPNQERETKFSIAYFGTLSNNVPQIPDNLYFVKSENGFHLVCIDCYPA